VCFIWMVATAASTNSRLSLPPSDAASTEPPDLFAVLFFRACACSLAPLLPRLQLLTLSRMELMNASQFMFKVRGRRRLALLLSPIYHSIPPVLGRAFVCVRVCVCVCVFIYACLVMLHECAFSCLTLLYILFLVTQTQLVFWFLVVAFALLVKASLFLRNNLFRTKKPISSPLSSSRPSV
jgi:hypothetical protein